MLLDRLPALARTRVILASASPRRADLLRQAGLASFDVRPSSFAEDLPKVWGHGNGEECRRSGRRLRGATDARPPFSPPLQARGRGAAYAAATAAAKATDVAAAVVAEMERDAAWPGGGSLDALLISADTVVEAPTGAILEKPADDADAVAMLTSLSGASHAVHTGVCLVALRRGAPTTTRSFCVSTAVTFAPLTPAAIAAYVATGEPTGKAGAYGVQGAAACFVSSIDGCYFNVVGLPLHRLAVEVGSMLDDGLVGVRAA